MKKVPESSEQEEIDFEIGDAMRYAKVVDASALSHDQLVLMLSMLIAAVGLPLDRQKPLKTTFFDAIVLATRKGESARVVISTYSKLHRLVEGRLRPLREARESDSTYPVGTSQHQRLVALFNRFNKAGLPVKNIPARVHAGLLQEGHIATTVHISSTRRALQRAELIPKPKRKKK